MEFNQEQQKRLLALARSSLERAAGIGSGPRPGPDPEFRQKRGAFVSLHRHGQLRGCIGTFAADKPLEDTVWEMARAAAVHDPRFRPLGADELPGLEVEISVLSPLYKSAPQEVEVGRHGIFIISPRGRGVLLPQVAVQYGWDRLTFLGQACRKAGLPSEAWKDEDVEVWLFTAQVFGEEI
ncbi:MAG: AmmeMemoRadiSam system protein A [Desulfarculales bacterium]|jgi:AmmeMemoRadiSam system protein A|nr:AmmeMemoRadiSam system protein A [Desulfarculales bacterium]